MHVLHQLSLRWGVVIAVATYIGLVCEGCAPKHPIVRNDTETWETEISAEMQTAEVPVEGPTQQAEYRELPKPSPPEEEEEHSAVVTALADVIGLPFRGAAWLARVVF